MSEASVVGWDTRARTRNNRTRICCVANYTISQFFFQQCWKERPSFELRCKGSAFPETDKGFWIFFSLKEHFSLFGGKKPREIRTFVGRKLKKMDKLIFISNDDGFEAEGIQQLAEMMRELGDVFVVAPDGGRSGASMSISSHSPVRNTFICHEEGSETRGSLTMWACTGTPNDCTKMAFEKLLPRRPDLVLGGINHGDNCAVNAHYSGTMSIALEGCIKHVPSIAFSSGRTAEDADFTYMKDYVMRIVKMVLKEGLPLEVCLNVNVPDEVPLKGLKICKMGMGDWHEEWQERSHPRGGKYYWIAGYYAPYDKHDEESDTWAYEHGYVAVTPLQLDMTAYATMKKLSGLMV